MRYKARGVRTTATRKRISAGEKRSWTKERRARQAEIARAHWRRWRKAGRRHASWKGGEAAKRLRVFGLSEDQIAREMLKVSCESCRVPFGTRRKSWHGTQRVWDHDHATGHYRGALCQTCNITAGAAKDDTARLRALADYLERA